MKPMDGFHWLKMKLWRRSVCKDRRGWEKAGKNQRLWPDSEILEFKVSRYWIFLEDGQVQG